MTGLESKNASLLERYLDIAAMRQKLIAENIANVDTPNYRTKDIGFSAELKHAMSGTNTPKPLVKEVEGLARRPDGNDVSVDRESMLLAQTQLQFRVGVQLLRTEFHRLLTAINEGRTA